MKKLPLVAILLFSTVFVVGSTCLIGSDSNKSTETMTLAVDGMACEEACATKIETALNSQIKNVIINAGYSAKSESSCDYDSKKASAKVGSSCESTKSSKESI